VSSGILFYSYLSKKKRNKNEIILCAYNLPEMINVAKNLGLKIKYYDLDYKTGSPIRKDIKKNISKKTLAVVLTNMFNTYHDAKKIKNILKKNKIPLIEDNAIYFDNYTLKNGKKYFSGSLGDFSIYSFNIMKNISSFYGGAGSTNDMKFKKFCIEQDKNLDTFFIFPLLKQITIFFILKTMSIKYLYKYIFSYIIAIAHKYKISPLLFLFYPSLKNINLKLPKYFHTKISTFAIKNTYLQLKDEKKRRELFKSRKKLHKFYYEKLKKINSPNFNTIKKFDYNYQNYLDFPVLVKDKQNLNSYLLKYDIEVRFKHYYNCAKIFKEKNIYKNAERYEKELICFPAHIKTKNSYIDFIETKLRNYY